MLSLDKTALSNALDRSQVAFGQLWVFYETGSTNDELGSRARQGAPDWSLVVAEAQKEGRGRRARSWASPPRVNLYLSLLSPPPSRAYQWPRIPIIAGVAAAKALGDQGVPSFLKWPNDLLLPSGEKTGGLLVERIEGRAIIGWGLNVNAKRGDLVAGGGSLHTEFGGYWSRSEIAAAFVQHFQSAWETFQTAGFGPILEAWEGRAAWLGQKVRAVSGSWETSGRMRGLDQWGRLRLEDEEGERLLSSGAVSLREG